jgi:proteasome maturation protein
MMQSNELKHIPSSSSVPATLTPSTGSTSVPVVHDFLAHGLPTTVSELNSRHPLESRLQNWNAQQDAMKLEMAKRLGGVGEVIRIATERMIVSEVSLLPTYCG